MITCDIYILENEIGIINNMTLLNNVYVSVWDPGHFSEKNLK